VIDALQIWQIWFIAGISLLTLETLIPGFVLAGVGISCLISALASYFGLGPGIQGLILFSGSGLFFITIRPLALKFLYPSKPENQTNAAALIGKTAMVMEMIDPKMKLGRVSTGGSYWIGISSDNTIIEADTLVEIVAISGATLTVKRKDL